MILLVACVVPVVVAGTVDLGGTDDVRLANASSERSAPTGADDTVSSPTTAAVESGGDSGGGDGGGGGRRATTTTEAEPEATTTTTEAATATTTTVAPTTTTTAPEPTPAEEVLALVNKARAEAATPCAPLTIDPHLQVAAQTHTDDMAARHYMDHVTPEGQDPAARAQAAGYTGTGVGENIAQGYSTAASVMTGWMESDGHRANIENCSYTVIGIGANPNGWYWTQVFGL
jgi:uncharacterized protein YkwD